MKRPATFLLASSLLFGGFGCDNKDEMAPSGQTCEDERLLETYKDRQAVVAQTQLDTYCLLIYTGSPTSDDRILEKFLVPVPASSLPAQFRVEGARVLLSGRKKSCYGLTTLPNLRTMFGYKLEIDAVKQDPAHPDK